MVVDTSALLAVLLKESDGNRLSEIIVDSRCSMSAATYFETGIVADRQRERKFGERLDELIRELAIEIVPFSLQQANIAREAYRRFGKGRHPARLNMGDCFAYALAKSRGEPLLFKIGDFALTDVEIAHG